MELIKGDGHIVNVKFLCTNILIDHLCGIILPRNRRGNHIRNLKEGLQERNVAQAHTHLYHRTFQGTRKQPSTPRTGQDTISTIVVHPLSCKHLAKKYL